MDKKTTDLIEALIMLGLGFLFLVDAWMIPILQMFLLNGIVGSVIIFATVQEWNKRYGKKTKSKSRSEF
jgi:hypothetical protein